MMTDYYEKSIKALQLAGMSERTQGCYTRAIRKLVDFYHHQKTWQQPDPDHVTGFFEVHHGCQSRTVFTALIVEAYWNWYRP